MKGVKEMMMFLLGITATAGAAFTAGRLFENWVQEQRAIRRRKARKAKAARMATQRAKDTLFFATVKTDAPGAGR